MSRQTVKYIKYKPKELNDATWRALCEAWENGLSNREAAFYVTKQTGTQSLTPNDINTLCAENADLEDFRIALASDLLSIAKGTIAESLRDGDIKTAKWYAERKGADEFSTKQAIEMNKAVIELSIEDKRKAAMAFIEEMKNAE